MLRPTLPAFVVLALLVAVTVPVRAQNTISQQRTLNTPGAWVLTQDLVVPCNGTPMIDVQVDGVTLDLQGFVLDCEDDSAPLIRAIDQANLVVRNGQLEGGDNQQDPLIDLDAPSSGSWPRLHNWTYRLESLRLREFETAVKARGSLPVSIDVRDCDLISGRGKHGLDLVGFAGVVVRDTRIRLGRLIGSGGNATPNFSGGSGIKLEGIDLVEIRKTAIYRARHGIDASGVEGGVVADNLLSWNERGVRLTESRQIAIRDNVLTGNEDCFDAIAVLDGATENSVERNTMLGYPMGVVFGESGNHFSDNRFRSAFPSSIPYWDQTGGGNVDGGRNVS